ncbi:MAG: beta-lactamase family protein [Saprospiraceae bacterium]|nr:beta-lactamase family protein [Saprospiraceae bacterium]
MKSQIIILFLLPITRLCGQGFQTGPCPETNYPELNREVIEIMQQIVNSGVPGMAAAIEVNGVLSIGSAGLAKLEDQTPMQTCHLQYLGSIPKLYLATLIMKLYENGQIDLDVPVTRYLPEDFGIEVQGMEKMTIRMLLNHTSGLPEYNYDPRYVTLLLQYPDRVFTPLEMLKFIDGKDPQFEPGTTYRYTNANYELLSIVADRVTGDHARYMQKIIFAPLSLTDTYYRIQAGYTYQNRLVNSYWDRFSNGILENSSILLNSNTASMAGDDGIVATPIDGIKFLKGLIGGKIVSGASLSLMKEWVKDAKGNPTYGLGLDLTELGGEMAIGHSGGGLGTGVQLYYFPEKNTYIFLAINLATVTESPIHEKVLPLLEKLYEKVLHPQSIN